MPKISKVPIVCSTVVLGPENRECQEFCNDNEDCEFFTLEEEKGVCVLLSECSEFKFGEDVSGWFHFLFFSFLFFFGGGGQETKSRQHPLFLATTGRAEPDCAAPRCQEDGRCLGVYLGSEEVERDSRQILTVEVRLFM